MYRIKQVRPGKKPLYLGHPINGKNIWWEDPKYAKPFLTRQEGEAMKRILKNTKDRTAQLHVEPIKV